MAARSLLRWDGTRLTRLAPAVGSMSAGEGAGCRAHAEDWCGHGRCVETVETTLSIWHSSNSSLWRCVCEPGWSGSLVDARLDRCVMVSAMLRSGIGLCAAASLLIVLMVVRNAKLGRLNLLRASFTTLACVIIVLVAAMLLWTPPFRRTVEDGLGRTVLFFVFMTLVLTLLCLNGVVVVDRYVRATSTTARALQVKHNRPLTVRHAFGQMQEFSSGTKHVMVLSIACWLLTCVIWACAGAGSKALFVGLLADVALVASAALRHVLASTGKLRHDIAFAESQVEDPELLSKLRRLRMQIARRRSAVVPSALCTILVAVSILGALLSPLAQDVVDRADYLCWLLIPNLAGDMYGRGMYACCANREVQAEPASRVSRVEAK